MTEIVVDMNELKKYSTKLEEHAHQFGVITKNMQEIIDSLKRRGWSGKDANAFITSAVKYLEDLKIVKDALLNASEIVRGRNQRYNKRVTDYYDIAKVRRDEQNG